MKLMKKYFSVIAVGVLALSLANCSSSDATDTADTVTGTGDDAQTTSAVSATASSTVGSALGGVSGSEGVATLVRAAVKQKLAVVEESYSEETTVSCSGGGSVTSTFDGTFSIDDVTYEASINVDASNTLDECTEEVTFTTADSQECTFTTISDGSMTMNMTGDFNYTESTVDLAATAGTDEQCSGMSITLNGTEHIIGIDLSMDFSGSVGDSGPEGEPTITGTICVDDELIDVETVADLSEFDLADLACE